MSPDFGHRARQLLGETTGVETSDLAERATQACERFAKHLSRLLGETGVELLLKRSVMLASSQFVWLVAVSTAGNTASGLRGVLAQQDTDTISEAFVAILSTFVSLLERLIGAGLVDRLLGETWPAVFSHAAKDTP